MTRQWLCKLLPHTEKKVVGFAQNPVVIEKSNKGEMAVPGLWLLSQCARCRIIYSVPGNYLGSDKVPVKSANATFFVKACANGCRESELEIGGEPGSYWYLSCNFCRVYVQNRTLEKTIEHWDTKQMEGKK